MSLSTSLLSYPDCTKFMDKALEFTEGARKRFDNEAACTHFRMRCHQARSLDREENARVYPKGMFMHGRSTYDVLTLRIYEDEGAWWVYAERRDDPAGEEEIEGLGERIEAQATVEALPPAEPKVFDLDFEEEPKQIPDLRRKV